MASELPAAPVPSAPHLSLDGFEGPLDLLLDLARAQKVDLARISILQLVEQYLAVVEQARAVRLELAADWLVMAAWLAWLKSRLLLPADETGEAEAEEAAGVLHERLVELEAMREAARWLNERPRLGIDVHARGREETLTEIDRTGLRVDLSGLIGAYLGVMRRRGRKRRYAPRRFSYWTVSQAAAALRRLLNAPDVAGWQSLESLVPDEEETPEARRAALAGALVAGLEMAKGGEVELRQDAAFAAILLRRPEMGAPGLTAGGDAA
ncbi:segregation and condensation protein A [Acidomonas methanolica]|uniref:Segregation and condensation protein A n=1 Tax=Acidomonas methanolica NBRC 104435 TaxID=1231351 RepID=A0A023D2A1_ACIMT|nr:ScpA family protein [Acidomonas methanolica]TCS31236.1 condensin subunit ScpA [Acidomonas methanolica]GAJ27946.1 chromosome segregation and condensation protein ScpA [Acidomonas methanolica NBRC 104435]GBQ56780.1 chromosome segregation and condensation protein ScpA [Acidomonas methanolica]GEK98517.1 segregation/condensation protein A [Acidomonas methanolica NBRC 104435]